MENLTKMEDILRNLTKMEDILRIFYPQKCYKN